MSFLPPSLAVADKIVEQLESSDLQKLPTDLPGIHPRESFSGSTLLP